MARSSTEFGQPRGDGVRWFRETRGGHQWQSLAVSAKDFLCWLEEVAGYQLMLEQRIEPVILTTGNVQRDRALGIKGW